MNELSHDDIRHLSRLARLDLTEEESDRYATQLSSVVDYIDQLQKVDTSKAEAHLGVTGLTNVLAADTPRSLDDPASIEVAAVIKAAPRSNGRLIEVRAVMGGEISA